MSSGKALVENWADVIRHHAAHYPLSTAQDWYKLIYQGTLGAEHLLQDLAAARQHLEAEWNAAHPQSGYGPIYDAIAPQNRVLRLYLRPLKNLNCPFEILWTAFENAAKNTAVEKGVFIETWQKLKERLPAPDCEAWDRAMAAKEYPVCHHSTIYRNAYAPAYRVVRLENCGMALEKFLWMEAPEKKAPSW